MDNYVITAGITLVAAYQTAMGAAAVGAVRRKVNIAPPKTTGHEDLERAFRAHQNAVEWITVFLALLWTATLFTSTVAAAVPGFIYLYARASYSKGYMEKAEKRRPGFALSINAIKALLGLCVLGLITAAGRKYFGFDLVPFLLAKVCTAEQATVVQSWLTLLA